MPSPEENRERIESYLNSRELEIQSCLGTGTQGSVYLVVDLSVRRRIAVKFHERETAYLRERDVYLRLYDLNIDEVCGHMVPQLIGYDDDLRAIEMTTVSPPFVLDFGGAYLDHPPDYSDEVWEDWRQQKSEAFEDNWPAVEQILDEFRDFGIHIADVNPGNIRFRNSKAN